MNCCFHVSATNKLPICEPGQPVRKIEVNIIIHQFNRHTDKVSVFIHDSAVFLDMSHQGLIDNEIIVLPPLVCSQKKVGKFLAFPHLLAAGSAYLFALPPHLD